METTQKDCAEFINERVSQIAKEKGLSESDVREKVKKLCKKFPIFNEVEALEVIDAFVPSRTILNNLHPEN